jgi:hypothetical protein
MLRILSRRANIGLPRGTADDLYHFQFGETHLLAISQGE